MVLLQSAKNYGSGIRTTTSTVTSGEVFFLECSTPLGWRPPPLTRLVVSTLELVVLYPLGSQMEL